MHYFSIKAAIILSIKTNVFIYIITRLNIFKIAATVN